VNSGAEREKDEWLRRVLGMEVRNAANGGPGQSAPTDIVGIWWDAKDPVNEQLDALRHAILKTSHPLAARACENGLGGFSGGVLALDAINWARSEATINQIVESYVTGEYFKEAWKLLAEWNTITDPEFEIPPNRFKWPAQFDPQASDEASSISASPTRTFGIRGQPYQLSERSGVKGGYHTIYDVPDNVNQQFGSKAIVRAPNSSSPQQAVATGLENRRKIEKMATRCRRYSTCLILPKTTMASTSWNSSRANSIAAKRSTAVRWWQPLPTCWRKATGFRLISESITSKSKATPWS
jgi:hypothetical protein